MLKAASKDKSIEVPDDIKRYVERRYGTNEGSQIKYDQALACMELTVNGHSDISWGIKDKILS